MGVVELGGRPAWGGDGAWRQPLGCLQAPISRLRDADLGHVAYSDMCLLYSKTIRAVGTYPGVRVQICSMETLAQFQTALDTVQAHRPGLPAQDRTLKLH